MDAVKCGSDYIGWYAAEHKYMIGIAVPVKTEYTKYGCPERWRKMLEVSKKITSMDKRHIKAETAILISYDSILAYGYQPLLYTFITLYKDARVMVDFITEKHLEKKPDILEDYHSVFLGYTPILRKSLLPALENYVEKGGMLIVCCNDLRFDEKLKNLSNWRKRFFGIIEEKIIWKEDSIKLTDKIPELENITLKAFWERHAIITTEKFIDILSTWSNGLAAIVSRKIGDGQVVYIGTRPYLANCIIKEKKWADFAKSLIKGK